MARESRERARILLLSTHAWTVRNLLLNPGFQSVLATTDVHVWTPAPEALTAAGLPVEAAAMAPLVPSGLRRHVVDLCRVSYAHRFGSVNLRSKLQRAIELRQGRVLATSLEHGRQGVGRLLALGASIRMVEALERWAGSGSRRRHRDFTARIAALAPDVVVSTCPQFDYTEWAPLAAARSLGIPSAILIPSWDNLSTKGRLPGPAERYFVWSEPMAGELTSMYGVAPDRIVTTGAPGMDCHAQPEFRESRDAFFARHGLHPAGRLLVYGGVTPGLMPNDPAVCRVLLEAIRDRPGWQDLQVLVRLHPKDPGDRWESLRRAYPAARIVTTNHAQGNLVAWRPTPQSVTDLVSTIRYADVNVNVASTLTLDAAVARRPVVNVCFDPEDPVQSRIVQRYYDYDHYRPVTRSGAVALADNTVALLDAVERLLADPGQLAAAQERLVDQLVGPTDGRAAVRFGEGVLQLAGVARRRLQGVVGA